MIVKVESSHLAQFLVFFCEGSQQVSLVLDIKYKPQ